MHSKLTTMILVAAVAFRQLAASRQIEWLYNRWFVRPLPSGQRLDMPMSRELRIELELLGLPRD